MSFFSKKKVLKINSYEADVLLCAIYTQLEVLKDKKDFEAKTDKKHLKGLEKKIRSLSFVK